MKKINILFAGIALIAGMTFASCSSKGNDSQNNAEGEATVETVAETAKSSVIELMEDTLVTENADKLIVIDFNATWCGPCQKFKPTFHAVADKYADNVTFISVDVDRCPNVATKFGVSSIPQITYVKTDGTIDSTVGLMSEEEFETALKAHM